MPEIQLKWKKNKACRPGKKDWKVLSFVVLLFSYSLLNAQITAPDKSYAFKAAYASNAGNDSVFIFNQPVYGGKSTVSLAAVSPDRNPGWSFIWSAYNIRSDGWDIMAKADTGMVSILDTITTSAGYRVIFIKNAVSDTFIVWTLFNDFQVEIINRNDSNYIKFGDYSCVSVSLRADTNIISLYYPEPEKDTSLRIINSYTIRWRASDEEAETPPNRLITRIESPPYKETWYKITITDNFNLSRQDSVKCPAIASKASMSAEHIPLTDSTEYPDIYQYYYDEEESAPGKWRLDFSESENAVYYKISFGDGKSTEYLTDTVEVVHEYPLPQPYTATLYTRSPEPLGCTDSFRVENVIELMPPELTLPNVFTPNGDNNNDLAVLYKENNVFRSEDASVEVIEITIFDRIGNKVHKYEGNIRDWEGWDGLVMDSNRRAPEGVYFYCITRYYYAPVSESDPRLILKDKASKGFIHLYRD
jgi:gliding motility-associated-like protein